MTGTVFFVQCTIFCLDGYFTDACDSIPGIDAEIGKDLVDLRRVHLDWPQIFTR